MFDSNNKDDVWQVWIKRIVVTIMIVIAVEVLGKIKEKQQQQQRGDAKKMKNSQEDEPTALRSMRYTDLSSAAAQGGKEDDKHNKESESTDVSKAEKENIEHMDGSQDVPKEVLDNLDDEAEGENEEEQKVALTDTKQTNYGATEVQNYNSNENNAETSATNTNNSTENIDNNRAAETTTTTTTTPIFKNKSPHHPGMEGFHHWYDIETSLFRQYNVGRTDDVDVIPPYVPKSRNGQVRVALQVVNQLTWGGDSGQQYINVYWMNYQGHEEFKGSILRGETWTQTTYVEHPWVFRLSDTDQLLLHYIPERVIPTLDECPTHDPSNPMVGIQRFVFLPPSSLAQDDHFICSIDDKIMPHPARHHFHHADSAHSWTLLQMKRLEYFDYHAGGTLLKKYLTNIVMNPSEPNYRRIRIANPKFYHGIWQTAARGLLLAAGFV